MKIAIFGAGAFGTTLGGVLIEKGYSVDYYDPFLSDRSLMDVLEGAEMVLMVAPSSALESLLAQIPRNLPMIVATKGIINSNIFDGFLDVMVISGPGFADDIKAHKKTFLTITDERLREMFGVDYLVFDETKDYRGVLMCGALKNVYAIFAGYMSFKPGTLECLNFIDEATKEMGSILAANGAEAKTTELYCGRDDLVLSCSEKSRNYEFGMRIRQNENYQPEKTVEGLSALSRIKHGEINVPDSAKILKQLMDII